MNLSSIILKYNKKISVLLILLGTLTASCTTSPIREPMTNPITEKKNAEQAKDSIPEKELELSKPDAPINNITIISPHTIKKNPHLQNYLGDFLIMTATRQFIVPGIKTSDSLTNDRPIVVAIFTYNHNKRQWRHLDHFDSITILVKNKSQQKNKSIVLTRLFIDPQNPQQLIGETNNKIKILWHLSRKEHRLTISTKPSTPQTSIQLRVSWQQGAQLTAQQGALFFFNEDLLFIGWGKEHQYQATTLEGQITSNQLEVSLSILEEASQDFLNQKARDLCNGQDLETSLCTNPDFTSVTLEDSSTDGHRYIYVVENNQPVSYMVMQKTATIQLPKHHHFYLQDAFTLETWGKDVPFSQDDEQIEIPPTTLKSIKIKVPGASALTSPLMDIHPTAFFPTAIRYKFNNVPPDIIEVNSFTYAIQTPELTLSLPKGSYLLHIYTPDIFHEVCRIAINLFEKLPDEIACPSSSKEIVRQAITLPQSVETFFSITHPNGHHQILMAPYDEARKAWIKMQSLVLMRNWNERLLESLKTVAPQTQYKMIFTCPASPVETTYFLSTIKQLKPLAIECVGCPSLPPNLWRLWGSKAKYLANTQPKDSDFFSYYYPLTKPYQKTAVDPFSSKMGTYGIYHGAYLWLRTFKINNRIATFHVNIETPEYLVAEHLEVYGSNGPLKIIDLKKVPSPNSVKIKLSLSQQEKFIYFVLWGGPDQPQSQQLHHIRRVIMAASSVVNLKNLKERPE